MVTIIYQDERGADHIDYPRTVLQLETLLRRLRRRHLVAKVRDVDGSIVGGVYADSAAPGDWTWWYDPDILPQTLEIGR